MASTSRCPTSPVRESGSSTRITTARPKPSPSLPMETSEVTETSLVSTFISRATAAIALAKQAAYPAAKSCSGLVPLPLPPRAGGRASGRSS